MALSKDKKNQVVAEVADLLSQSKMTVVATYQGTPVKAMQDLRKAGQEKGTTFKVVKNRLFKKAIQGNDTLKDADTGNLSGMLLYAFNDQDEVTPAQVLADFAKQQPTLEFVGAYSAEGKFLDAEQVTALSKLPGREQLIAEVIATLQSPVQGVTSALAGNLHGLLDAVAAKAES